MELDGEEGCEGNETSLTAGLRVPESCVGEPSVPGVCPPRREIAFPHRFYWKQRQQQVSALCL